MKKSYQTKAAPVDLTVPDAVTVATAELADSMREGLLALAVGAGLQVMQVIMSENVVGLCGPEGAHDPDRSALRHGSERARSPSAAGGSPFVVPGCGAPTAPPKWRCGPMTSSPPPSCWARWRCSG